MEDRLGIMASFYGVPMETIVALAAMAQSDRKPICARLGINPYVVRTMADYDRYIEAEEIHKLLVSRTEPIDRLSVLDFGCLVSDHGIYFARLGADVSIYDTKEAVDFAEFRYVEEGLCVKSHQIPTDGKELMRGVDLAIFGEVLEHMEDPLIPIRDCIDMSVKYIFTSCYPFGDAEYFKLSGHLKSAQDLQPDCIRLLSHNYDAIPSINKTVLWCRRRV